MRFSWLRSHPLTTTFLGLVAFLLALNFIANWRAEIRWQKYCEQARARGVKLSIKEWTPPEIPDQENFAALPMLRATLTGGVRQPMDLPVGSNWQRPDLGNAMQGERIDWKKWQQYCKDTGWLSETTNGPVRDVLRGLEHFAPQYQQWREWRTRPRCRFALDYDKGIAMPIPHLATFTDAARLFALRMRAQLALRNSPAAFTEFSDGLQAYRALAHEPTLIAGLVRMSVLFILIGAVGDGLLDGSWQDSELKLLAADFDAIDGWADFRLAFGSELARTNSYYQQILDTRPWNRASFLSGTGVGMGSSADWLLTAIPSRLYRDNQLRQNLYVEELIARVSPDNQTYNPDLPTPSDTEHLSGYFDPYYYFVCKVSLPIYTSISKRYVRLQTQIDLARLAIALSRFHAAHGVYPDSLKELVPQFIPTMPMDTYSRQPLIYRRTNNGSFLLYGVGENRADNGGKTDSNSSENQQPDQIWFYSPQNSTGS